MPTQWWLVKWSKTFFHENWSFMSNSNCGVLHHMIRQSTSIKHQQNQRYRCLLFQHKAAMEDKVPPRTLRSLPKDVLSVVHEALFSPFCVWRSFLTTFSPSSYVPNFYFAFQITALLGHVSLEWKRLVSAQLPLSLPPSYSAIVLAPVPSHFSFALIFQLFPLLIW